MLLPKLRADAEADSGNDDSVSIIEAESIGTTASDMKSAEGDLTVSLVEPSDTLQDDGISNNGCQPVAA